MTLRGSVPTQHLGGALSDPEAVRPFGGRNGGNAPDAPTVVSGSAPSAGERAPQTPADEARSARPGNNITLTCECGARWTIQRRRGNYPTRCPSCVARDEAKAADREDAALRRATEAGIRKRTASLKSAAILRRWAPILTDPQVMAHGDTLTRVARATQTVAGDAISLKRAVVRVAHAEGAAALHAALVELAAAAIVRADQVPATNPDGRDAGYARPPREAAA